MDMADGNFTTNHTLLGKKNGSEHDDRNDRFCFPPRSAPTWVHFTLPHFSNTNKTKTSKVYPKYWPTKTEPFGSTSISLYVTAWRVERRTVHVDLCRYFVLYFILWPVSTVAQQPETQLSTWIKYGFDYYINLRSERKMRVGSGNFVTRHTSHAEIINFVINRILLESILSPTNCLRYFSCHFDFDGWWYCQNMGATG